MRKAALLYNPVSGGGRRRKKEVEAALELFRRNSIETELKLTHSSVDTTEQARAAALRGCDTIFACGGDGTIHDIVQGIAGTNTALAILPMGTANALAHDLELPVRPLAAAKAILEAVPMRIALGKVEYQSFDGRTASRYFTVAAGIGVDAHLFYKLNSTAKHRLGMVAYYAKAWQLWMTHKMRRFSAQWQDARASRPQSASLTELMAVRIGNFGGVLRDLVPGASLRRDDLRMVMCRTSSRAAYLNYVARSVLRLPRNVEGVDVVANAEVACKYDDESGENPSQPVYVEADGELLGTLPARMSIVTDALTLLVPREFASRDGRGRV